MSILNLSDWPADFASCGWCLCFVCAFDLPSYMTTGVHVDVILTASSHVRTEPQSVIGQKNQTGLQSSALLLVSAALVVVEVQDLYGIEDL